MVVDCSKTGGSEERGVGIRTRAQEVGHGVGSRGAEWAKRGIKGSFNRIRDGAFVGISQVAELIVKGFVEDAGEGTEGDRERWVGGAKFAEGKASKIPGVGKPSTEMRVVG